jgi:hypothetical protein
MECMICGEGCKRRSKVFAGGKKLFACRKCVLKLRTHELVYCETCQKFRFNRILRKESASNTVRSTPQIADPSI